MYVVAFSTRGKLKDLFSRRSSCVTELVCVFVSLHVLVSQSFHCIIWVLGPAWLVVCKYTLNTKENKHTRTLHMLPSNYVCRVAAGWLVKFH